MPHALPINRSSRSLAASVISFFLFLSLASGLAHSQAWTTPVDLSGPDARGQHPQIAVDASGNIIAVWFAEDGPNRIIQSSRYDAGSASWREPVTISLAGQSGLLPVVASDSAGNAITAWVRTVSETETLIQAARYDAATMTWSVPVDLSIAGQTEGPRVAMDGAGNAVVFWTRGDGTFRSSVARAARYNATTGIWGAPADVSVPGSDAREPRVGVDGSGNFMAIWAQDFIIRSARYDSASMTWLAPADVSTTLQSRSPEIAVDVSGTATAVWLNTTSGVQSSRYDPMTGTWSAPDNLSTTTASSNNVPKVIVTSGRAAAIWLHRDGDQYIIQGTTFSAGSWAAPIDIGITGTAFRTPSIAMDASGITIVVWSQFTPGSGNPMRSARYDAATMMWSAPVDMGEGGSSLRPQVLADSDGNFTAVWFRAESALYRVRSAYSQGPPYSIGGTVSGLAAGNSVTLRNDGEDLIVNANGDFAFANEVAYGESYDVSIISQPEGQTCSVTGSAGDNVMANVTSVEVVCVSDTYSIGGMVSGLAAGTSLVLDNAGSEELTINANGAFTFANEVALGGSYNVVVAAQPAGQSCSVVNGSGTVMAEVTNIEVTCLTNTYSVGGTVSGLFDGETVVLQNNGADDLSVGANGPFTFATDLMDGAPYAVSVLTQPAGQICSVSDGGGVINGASVSTVIVACMGRPTDSTSTIAAPAPIVFTRQAAAIVVTPRDALGNALPDILVSLDLVSASVDPGAVTIDTSPTVSDSNGQARFEVRSTVAQTLNLRASFNPQLFITIRFVDPVAVPTLSPVALVLFALAIVGLTARHRRYFRRG